MILIGHRHSDVTPSCPSLEHRIRANEASHLVQLRAYSFIVDSTQTVHYAGQEPCLRRPSTHDATLSNHMPSHSNPFSLLITCPKSESCFFPLTPNNVSAIVEKKNITFSSRKLQCIFYQWQQPNLIQLSFSFLLVMQITTIDSLNY